MTIRPLVLAISSTVAVVVVAIVGYYVWDNHFSGRAIVIRQVKLALVDPDSSKFGEIEYFPETKYGCGVVNSKNRMGGYVGNTTFLLKDGEVTFEPAKARESDSIDNQIATLKKSLAFYEAVSKHCPKDQTK